jgi:battenin
MQDEHHVRLWWCVAALGLLNNTPYVLMLAVAKYMNEGGTAVVYIVNTVPGLLVKLTGPYWFDYFSTRTRLRFCSISLTVACLLTSWASAHSHYAGQLLGVALVSLQIGLGEASLLALAGKLDNSSPDLGCLKAFAAGTGLAGPFGYL